MWSEIICAVSTSEVSNDIEVILNPILLLLYKYPNIVIVTEFNLDTWVYVEVQIFYHLPIK